MSRKRWNTAWYLIGRKAFSRTNRGWWSGVITASAASFLIMLGVIFLVGTVTSNILNVAPTGFYMQLLYYVLQPLLAVAMIGLGTALMLNVIWKVGASAERRGSIVSRADELEFLNEVRRRRADFPTVPGLASGPFEGKTLGYRLVASRRSFWGLVMAGILCLLFAIIVAVLVVTAYVKWKMGRTDWVAGMLAIPISFAMAWSFYRFLKQLLKTASIGPTNLEMASFPITPGVPNEFFISQTGRLRLKLFEAYLVCNEEATFNQGTNTLTERRQVYSQRLFRRRGISLNPGEPFEARIPLEIPSGAMHSFQTSSNRITWQIEIQGQIKGFPKVNRIFEIVVIPTNFDQPKVRLAQLQPA